MLRAAVLVTAAALYVNAAAADDLRTIAERSGFRKTGRYEEVERLCPVYAARWPDSVRCEEFGRTPEGRSMLALIVSSPEALTAAEARDRGLPVLFMQGGIHAGEIDGKDAGFLALREMLEGRIAPGVLERIVIVFVPVFNIDGHERFGAWNRPNQTGPEEMGWRVTGQNLNLNRDYAKADSAEMRALLRLLNEWDPILYLDLHVTDGAQFRHDISNTVEPRQTGDPDLWPTGTALNKEANARIAAKGALPIDFYPSLANDNDPAAGFKDNVPEPRFSTGYWALRNRFAVLVETHSWKDYPTRVRRTHDTIVAFAELAARDGRNWREAARRADETARRLGGQSVAVAYKTTATARMLEFMGFRYERTPSPVSGGLALRYDTKQPETWHVPLYNEARPDVEVTAPRGGYVVPAAHAAWMSERLGAHAIEFRVIDAHLPGLAAQAFRATKTEFAAAPFEGHTRLTLTGAWSDERRAVDAGALFVPIAQPKARLVMALLEPQAPDSFAAWGFFNAHFEKKEYMDDYVAEAVGREMLATQPEIAAEFERKLAMDPEFAKDPKARLEFFYRKHASWDERFNLYPILRLDADPQ
ncbi:MAG TPA: M14 family zinc carboxypeptidase [Gammaproteobacteria bacterium]